MTRYEKTNLLIKIVIGMITVSLIVYYGEFR